MSEYITPAEYAKRIGVHPDTVIRWIHSGRLVALCVSLDENSQKKRWRIRQEDIDDFERNRMSVKPCSTRPTMRVRSYV